MLSFQINHIRNINRVHVYGTDIPPPVLSFEQLAEEYNLHKQIVKNIASMGYSTPTPIQMQAIPAMLQVRN